MARAHFVKKARRAYRADGIKKGQPYWWWKFNYGSKRRSLTQPRPSQLTQSDFYSQLYGIQEQIEDLSADENLADEIQNIADSLRELGSECEDRRSNMPDSLQDSETGNLLEERASACDGAADELEGIDCDFEADSDDNEEETEHAEGVHWAKVLEEVQGVSLEID